MATLGNTQISLCLFTNYIVLNNVKWAVQNKEVELSRTKVLLFWRKKALHFHCECKKTRVANLSSRVLIMNWQRQKQVFRFACYKLRPWIPLFYYPPLSKYPSVSDLTNVAVLSLKFIYTSTCVIIQSINAASSICARIRGTVIYI